MSVDPVTIFGFAAVLFMMIFNTLEDRHRYWALAFALSCFACATYAVMTKSWPFALVESVWGGLKLYKYLRLYTRLRRNPTVD
jgi:hypothetical protein